MKKFKNAAGTIYAPQSADVEEMMLKDERFTVVAAKKTTKKSTAKTADTAEAPADDNAEETATTDEAAE